MSNNENIYPKKALKIFIKWIKQKNRDLKLNISKTGVKSSTYNYFIGNSSRKNTNESYMLERKRDKKMHTKCHKMHKLPLEMYPTCIYRPIYICTIKQKTSFTVSSFYKSHHWRCDISSRKHRHIGKAQSMVWRRSYMYTCHVSTIFFTCNFLTLCMLLKLLVMLSTVDLHPHARHHSIPSQSCL